MRSFFLRSSFKISLAFTATFISILASFFIYNLYNTFENEQARQEFQLISQSHIRAIEREVAAAINITDSLEIFYNSSSFVDRQEFKNFTALFLQRNSNLQALEWVPYVPYEQRGGYEENARQDGFEGFKFTERKEQGEMIKALRRDAYFPVYYVEPVQENEAALGFDLGSNPARLTAIQQARDTGKKVATKPIKLVQENTEQRGVLIFNPIYKKGLPDSPSLQDRQDHMKGLVLSVIRIRDMIEGALLDAYGTETVSVAVTDVSEAQDLQTLYGVPVTVESGGFITNHTIDVAGNKWQIIITPRSEEFSQGISKNSKFALFIFLVVGVLLLVSSFTSKGAPPILLVQISFGILTIMMCLLLFVKMQAYSNLDFLEKGAIKLKILAKDIVYYDEVLTMSARLAISKKDLEWEERYQKYVPLLDRAIEDSLATFSDEEKASFLGETSVANQKLIALEESAFSLAHAGEWIKAENILYGEDYTSYKRKYMKGLRKLSNLLQEEVSIHRNSEKTLLRYDGYLSVMFLITTIVVGILVSFILRRWYKSEQQVREELEETNAELEEFAYRTSHDLRSPIISSMRLLGMAEEYISEGDTDTALVSLSHAGSSLQKLEALIKDMLALTEIKNKEEELKNIDIATLVKNALEKMAYMENFEHLDIQTDFQFKGNFLAKETRLNMILENLISNSIKYQDLEKENSYIKIMTQNKNNVFILEVKDNGLGIPENQQENLFTMFKRFHPKVAFGSGLGLYLMKKSADVLNGEISFHDHGDGTIFRLSVPL